MARFKLQKLTLEAIDEGEGPPVLLLHGFPTTNRLWSGVLPVLVRAGYRVIAPDLAGYGRSDSPAGGLDMSSQAVWMLELLDLLKVDRAAVVAHDVGTAAAQILAARAPERVRGLVLIDSVYADNWAMEAVLSLQKWDPAAASKLAPILRRNFRKQGISDQTLSEVLAPYEGDEGGRRVIDTARALDPQQTVTIMGVLRRLRVPSLVIWGERDVYLPVDQVGRPLADLLGAELRLLPGGHFLPLDLPAEVARELEAFLGNLPAEETPKEARGRKRGGAAPSGSLPSRSSS